MGFFIFNGKLFPDATPVIGPESRGLRYGDGLFETFKCMNGELILFDEHLARLWTGLSLMQFEIPKLFTPDRLQEETLTLLKKNNLTNARVRLALFRGDGGLYDHKNALNYTIQCWPIAPLVGKLNENGLQVGIYRQSKKAVDAFSGCKHNNFLPYVMAALYAKQMKLNDCLVLNQHGRICDSTIANIFVIKGESISSPPLNEGCIAGIQRKVILQTLASLNIPVLEAPLTEEILWDADEVFLSNSISNMRWVAGIEKKTFSNRYTQHIYHLLVKTIPGTFC